MSRHPMFFLHNCRGATNIQMVIFKGNKVWPIWRDAAPSGAYTKFDHSGYVNKKIFAEYREIFVHFLKNNLYFEEKNHFLPDPHKAHLFNITYMKNMLDNYIKALYPSSPAPWWLPLCLLQEELSTGFAHFNLVYLARTLTKTEFFNVFKPAWDKSLTSLYIQAGFRNCTVYLTTPVLHKQPSLVPARSQITLVICNLQACVECYINFPHVGYKWLLCILYILHLKWCSINVWKFINVFFFQILNKILHSGQTKLTLM